MDRLKIAHDYAMKHIQEGWDINYDILVVDAWQYADAMQAEADKREPSGLPEALCEVDWSLAPKGVIGWVMMSEHSYWHGDNGYLIGNAPSFGFTGSHIVERPDGF